MQIRRPQIEFGVGAYGCAALVLILLTVCGLGNSSLGETKSTQPERVQQLDTPGNRMHLAGKYLYVATGCYGLQVLDISQPTRPMWVGGWRRPDGWCVQGVQVVGERIYLAVGFGLEVLDAKDPRNPFSLGSVAAGKTIFSIHVGGSYAYLADIGGGLEIVDVSNPTNPKHIGSYKTPAQAETVQVVGNLAYVACSYGGLQILDVKDPAKPVTVATCCPYPVGARNIQVLGDLVYVAPSNSRRMYVIDVKNPSAPSRRGASEPCGYAGGIYTDGKYAYLATHWNGFFIIDVRKPDQPRIAGTYKTEDWCWDVRVSGQYAYLLDGNDGVQVLDVSDPTKPREVGSINRDGYVSNCLALKPESRTSSAFALSPSVINSAISTVASYSIGGMTDVAPTLVDPHQLANGIFTFVLRGTPNRAYVIHASTNLANWSAISTNTLPESGDTTIADPDAGSYAQRYYRAVKQ
jgi:hypothetical protein